MEITVASLSSKHDDSNVIVAVSWKVVELRLKEETAVILFLMILDVQGL